MAKDFDSPAMPSIKPIPEPPDPRVIPLDRQEPLTHNQVEQLRFGLGDTGPLAQAVMNANVPALAKQLATGAVQCLSTRRPADPVVGQMIFETDTQLSLFWSGSAWVNAGSPPIGAAGGMLSGTYPNPSVASISGLAAGGDLAGTYPNPVFAAGLLKIKQVLSVNYDTEFSTTSGSLSDTGLNLSITPSSTSSRIIVIATTPIRVDNSPNTGYYEASGVVTLRRGATNLQSHGVGGNEYEGGTKAYFSLSSFMYIDSPATTSAVNYKTMIKSGAPQFRIYSNNLTVYGGVDLDLRRSQMILIEVL